MWEILQRKRGIVDKEVEQIGNCLAAIARDVKSWRAKCTELLTRVEALEEELRGPKPGPITADDLLCMMQDVYEGLSEHGIYINKSTPR